MSTFKKLVKAADAGRREGRAVMINCKKLDEYIETVLEHVTDPNDLY